MATFVEVASHYNTLLPAGTVRTSVLGLPLSRCVPGCLLAASIHLNVICSVDVISLAALAEALLCRSEPDSEQQRAAKWQPATPKPLLFLPWDLPYRACIMQRDRPGARAIRNMFSARCINMMQAARKKKKKSSP